jgi:hypothetical protein
MKKPVGYKIGGMGHFTHEQSMNSATNSVKMAASSETSSVSLNRDEQFIFTDN